LATPGPFRFRINIGRRFSGRLPIDRRLSLSPLAFGEPAGDNVDLPRDGVAVTDEETDARAELRSARLLRTDLFPGSVGSIPPCQKQRERCSFETDHSEILDCPD
jgi:hypothetical protein